MFFPTNIPLQYPYARAVRVGSNVLEFLDGSEQRWQTTKVLNAFQIGIQELSWADLQVVRDWFAAVKGAFQSWDIVIAGETFTDMVLESDVLVMTEDSQPGRFSVSLAMRQTETSGTWPSVLAVYPTIAGGIITQYPFTSARSFHTVRNDLPSGPRYAYAERSTPRLSWVCSYPSITTTELLTLIQFAVAMGGKTKHFAFRDPETATVYPNCRFDQDVIQAEYRGPNECAIAMSVREAG